MKTVLLFLLLALLCPDVHGEKSNRSNVLIIAVDDLNDWAGYRGHPDVKTPNMDRLAGEGVWFSRAYCQYALCGPSRASFFSGMYFHQLGLDTLQAKDKDVSGRARQLDSKLLFEYFGDHGYKTMAVGKLLHKHVPKGSVDKSGGRGTWDFNLDEKGKKVLTNWDTGKTITDWAPFNGKESDMSDVKAASWAVDRLKEKHQKPFMLMVGFLRPHVPWYVPQKYFDMYDPAKITLPPYDKDDLKDVSAAALETINDGYPRTEWAIEQNQWRNIVHSYLASITFADAQVGKVLQALEQSDYRDDTIVILWSDHGYHMGEKNTFQKHTLWDRSALCSLIIKAPGMKQGQRCDAHVQLLDVYPTLLDLAQLPANGKLEGVSLKPLLLDPAKDWSHPAYTFRTDGGASVVLGHKRYIQYGDGSQELYDHQSDPNEWRNLADQPDQRDAIENFKRLLEHKTSKK